MEEKLPIIYSKLIEYDPLINVDFTETFKGSANGSNENSGNSSSTAENSSKSSNVSSDTPQGRVTESSLEDGIYASNTSFSKNSSSISDNTNTSSNGTSHNTNEYTRTQKGNSGALTTSQKLIEQFRDVVIAIDKDIIRELNILFLRFILNQKGYYYVKSKFNPY